MKIWVESWKIELFFKAQQWLSGKRINWQFSRRTCCLSPTLFLFQQEMMSNSRAINWQDFWLKLTTHLRDYAQELDLMFETVSSSFGCRMETYGTYDHLSQSERLVFSPCIRLSQKQEVPPASSRLIPAWIPKGWRTYSVNWFTAKNKNITSDWPCITL